MKPCAPAESAMSMSSRDLEAESTTSRISGRAAFRVSSRSRLSIPGMFRSTRARPKSVPPESWSTASCAVAQVTTASVPNHSPSTASMATRKNSSSSMTMTGASADNVVFPAMKSSVSCPLACIIFFTCLHLKIVSSGVGRRLGIAMSTRGIRLWRMSGHAQGRAVRLACRGAMRGLNWGQPRGGVYELGNLSLLGRPVMAVVQQRGFDNQAFSPPVVRGQVRDRKRMTGALVNE